MALKILQKLYGMFSNNIGIDLGTTNALVAYEPKSAEIFQLIYEALATAPSA